MTDDAVPAPAAAPAPEASPRALPPFLAGLRRLPVTIAFVVALIAVGAATGTLLSPAADAPWYGQVATGIPAFAEGRWWTLATSPFFVDHPLVYLTLLPLVVGGLGWAEWRFGGLRTIGLFAAGHVVGVLGAAGLLLLVAQTGWPWAEQLTQHSDVGPSCGALAALVFAIATLPAPWRLRARIAVVIWVGISLLYLGQLHDVEHAVAMVAALAVSGWLPAFRRPAGRPSEREWRLIAFSGLIAIGVIQVIDLIVPYDGPLGQNQPVASFIDVALDVIVIALIANGVRQGVRLAWICAIVLAAFNIATAALGFGALKLLEALDVIGSAGDYLGALIAPAALWALFLVVIIAGRGAFRVPLRRSRRTLAAEHLSTAQARERLARFGGGTISWMTTWRGNRHVAAGSGAITFQPHAGVAIMLGDPIVAAGEEGAAFAEFERIAQRAGLVPCAFSASEVGERAKPAGWRSVVIAEDTIVDLPGLAFTGKSWGAVRTAINRANREGISFRMVRLADEPWSVLAQVRAISEQWTGDKGLPEMRFTLGTVDEALDPAVAVGIAVDADGSLHGITSWLPVHGPADPETGEPRVIGWTLDLMRRRDGGFGPVMEFLIASAAQHFSEAGFAFLSLSGAPLVRPSEVAAGPVDQVLDQVGALIEPLYGFTSLHRFKQKFNPRSAPLYLLFRDEGDLPRIGIALTRAYLPDASLRDLLASTTAAKPAQPARAGGAGAK